MPISEASPQSSLETAPTGLIASLLAKPGLVQFLKFCTVGASNFALDLTVAFVLTFSLHVNLWLANTISFVVAVSNSFYWNRRWTFAAQNSGKQTQRYVLFVMLNTVGLGIDLAVMKAVMFAITGAWDHELSKPLMLVAKVVATSVVVFWNFFANKRWTFKDVAH